MDHQGGGGVTRGETSRAGARFWLTAAAGWVVMAYGVRGIFHHHLDTKPTNLATFAVGGALIHDLLFVPVVLLIGLAVNRAAPARVRSVVQGALIVSGSLVAFSYPLVRGYARVLHNPSSLPHNYTLNLAIVLGVVWAMAAVAMTVRLRHPKHRSSVDPGVPEG
jgi:hypothetical protein